MSVELSIALIRQLMASREQREDEEVIIAGPEDRRQTVLPEGDDRLESTSKTSLMRCLQRCPVLEIHHQCHLHS